MKSSEYWKKRFEQIEQAQHEKGLQCYDEIEKQYRRAQREIEGQIASWYQRFAANNGITMQEARKMLVGRDLKEFRWDVQDYIRYGKENAKNSAWMKQLENASARYHVSRLEALKLQTQQSLEVLFGNQLDSIDSAMRKIYTDGYYHTAFEIQKGVGIGWDFATLDNKTIGKVINKPWAADGKNFSERVWGNRQKLVNELNTELTRNIILGRDPQKAIDAIAKKMNTSKSNAGRLVMTEEAFFSSAAQKDSFEELDVEQFEIVATLDALTSEICREMDGKHYPMSQWEVGVTAPPFHPWCRTTTVPYFDDEFSGVGQRAARGEDGRTYYVPANMSYKEWQHAFVDGDKSGLQEAVSDDTINSERNFPVRPELLTQDQIIEKAKRLAELTDYEGCKTFQEIRAVTNKKLDYDALPTVLSDDEFLERSEGKTILYRGIHASGDKTVESIAEEFKYGALWTGNKGGAIAGNGVYFTAKKSIAQNIEYAGSDGMVIEMVLADDARVADYLEIATEFEKTGIPKIIGMPGEDYQLIIRDLGQYAAVKGYDAIALNGFNNHDYVVLLNRGKAIVRE